VSASPDSEGALSGGASKRTFRMLLLRRDPGVESHAPGGAGVRAGVRAGKELALDSADGAEVLTGVLSVVPVFEFFDFAPIGGRELDLLRPALGGAVESGANSRAGAGVAAHAPGGRGVFVFDKSA
jgi:hypothetical protein